MTRLDTEELLRDFLTDISVNYKIDKYHLKMQLKNQFVKLSFYELVLFWSGSANLNSNPCSIVPVALCVDSGIAYDDFAETVERIHDVFLVCFCAIHRKFPLSPTWGGDWFMVVFL